MPRVVYEFTSPQGRILVETDEEAPPGPVAVGRDSKVTKAARESFDEAIAGVKPIADAILSQTKGLSMAPEKVEVTFGIKISGEVGVILARCSTEANIQIKLTWEKGDG